MSTRTRAEIMASVSRRWASGEASHLARVSSKQVLLIRKFYTNGNVTQSALDERFANVGRIATTISTLKGKAYVTLSP
jgi:hypothetical protein